MMNKINLNNTIVKYFSFLILFLFTSLNNSLIAKSQNVDSLFTVIENTNNDSIYLNALFEISQVYRTSNPDTSIYYNIKVREKAADLNLFDLYYESTLALGRTYKYLGRYPDAIEITIDLLRMCEKKGEKDKIVHCLISLVEYSRASVQFDVGIEYAKQAIQLLKTDNNNDKNNLAQIYNRLSAIYYERIEVEKAQNYIDSAIIICKEIGFVDLMPSNLNILGGINANYNRHRKAISIYKQSIKINDSLGLGEEENIMTYINMSRSLYFLKKYKLALFYSHKAYELAKMYDILIYKENASMLLSLLYAAINDYEKAYLYRDTLGYIRNYLFDKNRNLQISELNKKYKTEKQVQAIKNQKLIINNRGLVNKILILVMFFLLVVIVLVLLFIINVRKKNKLLSIQNNKIEVQKNKIHYIAKQLEEENKTKDRFFSIIAHDLKSPLGTLKELSELLYESFDNFDLDELKKIIYSIASSSKNTFFLLENLLSWSLAQRNKIRYTPSTININDIIISIINLKQVRAKEKSINIIFEPLEDISVVTDVNLLRTILRNLLSNAIKYTEEGDIVVKTKKVNNSCVVSVVDSGVGISDEQLSKMFIVDQDISTKGTKGENGTGLGLILCKEFVQINKGRIWVESTLNKGSNFSFTIPLAEE